MDGGVTDAERLGLDVRTIFTLSPEGRLVAENEPGGGARPPIAWLASTADRAFAWFREDVDEAAARSLRARVEASAPWLGAPPPSWLSDAAQALSAGLGAPHHVHGLSPGVPAGRAIASGTPDGDALLARIAAEGPPPALAEAGFLGVDDFWAPWCAVIAQGEIASLAFAARLSPDGAEAGVHTLPARRGRGLAAQATSAWAEHPALAGKALFYSCADDNAASIAVTRRLGLRAFAATVRLVEVSP